MKKLMVAITSIALVSTFAGCKTPATTDAETETNTETTEVSENTLIEEEDDYVYVPEYTEDGDLIVTLPVEFMDKFKDLKTKGGTLEEAYEASFKQKLPIDDGVTKVIDYTTGGPIKLAVPTDKVDEFTTQIEDIADQMTAMNDDNMSIDFEKPFKELTINIEDVENPEKIIKEAKSVIDDKFAMNVEYYQCMTGIQHPGVKFVIHNTDSDKDVYEYVY